MFRYRGREAGRGDIDEALGNFSLTLIDSLDTLVVLGRVAEFEDAVLKVLYIAYDLCLSLPEIDCPDTLVVLGRVAEFEDAVLKVYIAYDFCLSLSP